MSLKNSVLRGRAATLIRNKLYFDAHPPPTTFPPGWELAYSAAGSPRWTLVQTGSDAFEPETLEFFDRIHRSHWGSGFMLFVAGDPCGEGFVMVVWDFYDGEPVEEHYITAIKGRPL